MAETFGGVGLSEIEAVAATTSLPDAAGASPLTRFVKRVSDLVRLRKAQGESGGVSIFLQSSALESDAESLKHQEFPFLGTGNEPILNQVWLSNASLGTAYALDDVDCADVNILKQAVKGLGLGSLPALLVDWRGAAPAGRVYLNGFADPDDVEDVQLEEGEIDPENLKACLDNFFAKTLRTPSAVSAGHGMRVWKKASQGIPEERPEERIQGRLMDHLRSRYSRHHIRAEVENDAGRCDLIVRAHLHDVSGLPYVRIEWLLELKALTDKTSTGSDVPPQNAKAAIEKGVLQAHSYRDQEHAQRAALCCYDMRSTAESDDDCFSHVAGDAAAQGVALWRWLMLRSAEAGRQAKAGEAIATG